MDTNQTSAEQKPSEPQVVHGVPSGATPAFDAKDIQDNKFIACLSYLSILVLIPLLLARKSPFAQEHAKQGVILFVIGIAIRIAMFIPVVNLIAWIASFVLAVVAIIAFVKCLMGEFWEIPVVGQYRKQVNIDKI